jgi:hypothetical protein
MYTLNSGDLILGPRRIQDSQALHRKYGLVVVGPPLKID